MDIEANQVQVGELGAYLARPVGVEALQAALQSRDTGATIAQFYPGADHGFADRRRHDKAVNADAFRLSWPQALAFIDVAILER